LPVSHLLAPTTAQSSGFVAPILLFVKVPFSGLSHAQYLRRNAAILPLSVTPFVLTGFPSIAVDAASSNQLANSSSFTLSSCSVLLLSYLI